MQQTKLGEVQAQASREAAAVQADVAATQNELTDELHRLQDLVQDERYHLDT